MRNAFRCKESFDFSDHIVLWIAHYSVPAVGELSYITTQVRFYIYINADISNFIMYIHTFIHTYMCIHIYITYRYIIMSFIFFRSFVHLFIFSFVHSFNFSKTITITNTKYSLALFAHSSSYIHSQIYSQKVGSLAGVLRYLPSILSSIILLILSLRGILLTTMFFHTPLESIIGFFIVVVAVLVPMHSIASKGYWSACIFGSSK